MESYLAENFVLVTHNQLPELYCQSAVVDTSGDSPYPAEQLARVSQGAGGGNVRCYFCTPEGKVVHYVAGYWKPPRMLSEARWVVDRVNADRDTLINDHRVAGIDLQRQRDQILAPDAAAQLVQVRGLNNQQQTALNEVRGYNRLIRSYRESIEIITRPIGAVLQQVEDDVYVKGLLGCDS